MITIYPNGWPVLIMKAMDLIHRDFNPRFTMQPGEIFLRPLDFRLVRNGREKSVGANEDERCRAWIKLTPLASKWCDKSAIGCDAE